MIAELQALSWVDCFMLTLKIGSAILCGMMVVLFPIAVIKAVAD